MLTDFTLQQTHILDSSAKDFSWLFEVVENGNTHYWSDMPRNYNGNSYTYKVSSFSPIKLSLIDGHTVGKNEMKIVLNNPGNALATADYANAAVTVRLIMSAELGYVAEDFSVEDFIMESDIQEAEIRSFCFEVHGEPINLFQQMTLNCRGWMERYLNGEYPNTSLIADLWPSEDNDDSDDNSCVPKVWGTAFIPIRSAYITDARYYILGAYSGSYTITKIISPRDYDSRSTWLNSEYDFQDYSKAGSDSNNYSCWQFLIVDSDNDGDADANGLFTAGERFLDVPCQYSWSGTSSMTALPNIIEYFLEDCGCPSAKIDDTSKAAVTAKHATWGVEYAGGFWYKRDREEILKEFLAQGHMYLLQRDKIYFNYYDKSSKLSLEKWHMKGNRNGDSITDQYSIYRLDIDTDHDSAYVAFQQAGRPVDELHKIKITTKTGTALPSSDCVNMPFLHDSQDAKKMGILFHQRDKKRHSRHSQTFKERILQLECGDVITINPTDYDGGGFDAVIQSMAINNDLSIEMEFVSYSCALDNFEDLSASAVTIATDDSENVFQCATTGPDSPGQIGDNRPNVMRGNRCIIPGGRDLNLEGSNTDPGIVRFKGSSYSVVVGCDVDGDRFTITPITGNVTDLILGDDESYWMYSKQFANIYAMAANSINLAAGASALYSGRINIDENSNNGLISLISSRIAPGYKESSLKWDYDNLLSLNHWYNGTLKIWHYQSDDFDDDESENLPASSSGILSVSCNAEAGQWLIQTDGTVIKISGTTNTASTDSDGNLCVYDNGSGATIKNRLNVDNAEVRAFYFYN